MKLIVLTGLPASGKSRLARALQEEFGWPVLNKDSLKEELFDTVGFENYQEKRALDHAANAVLLRTLESLLKSGVSVIVDNNFDVRAAERLMKLVEQYRPELAVVELGGDVELFYERYVKRDLKGKRHPGHALQDHYPLREGEVLDPAPMTREEYKEKFIDRGMARADWAPERIHIELTEAGLPVQEIIRKIKEKFENPSGPSGHLPYEGEVNQAPLNRAHGALRAPVLRRPERSGDAVAEGDWGVRPVVAFPFRSFPELVDDETVRILEKAGFTVRANRSGKRLPPEEMKEMIRDAFAVVAGSEKYDAETLAAAENLKVIIRLGVGLDGFDLNAIREKGIRLGVIANDYAVAEHALMLMLSLLRRQPIRERELRDGKWNHTLNDEMSGKTVGLLGFGRIGQRLAKLLSSFPVKVIAYDPYFNEAAGTRLGVRSVSREELLKQSDIISLHLPGTAENAGLVNSDFLAAVKPGTYLINTARGSLVDEAALCEALKTGQLAGAALDAFRTEPLPQDSPLFEAPNLVLTPHIAALTKETNLEACRTAVRSILSVRNGGDVEYPVKL